MIADGDASGCISLLAELHARSKDIARIIDELSMTFRDLMLYKTIPNASGLLSAMPCDHAEIARLADKFSLEDILRCLTLLQQCADSIGKTRQRRTAAEMCLVRMCLKLSAQDNSAPRREAAASPAPAISPAAPAQAPNAAVKFVEIPQEKFEPTPLKDLSPQSAANISKIRELQADMEKVLNEREKQKPAPAPVQTSAPKAEKDVFAPPPVMNSTPAAPDNFEAPPPEEPPEEYIPQREFETAPPVRAVPAEPAKPAEATKPIEPVKPVEKAKHTDEPEKPALADAHAEAPKPEEKPIEQEVEQDKPAPAETKEKDGIRDITAEEWNSAVEKISDVMLFGSTVQRDGDTLVVNVATAFVANSLNSNSEERREKTDEICEALGIKAAVRFECPGANNASAQAENENEEVKKLLKKAEQLDIEVIKK